MYSFQPLKDDKCEFWLIILFLSVCHISHRFIFYKSISIFLVLVCVCSCHFERGHRTLYKRVEPVIRHLCRISACYWMVDSYAGNIRLYDRDHPASYAVCTSEYSKAWTSSFIKIGVTIF